MLPVAVVGDLADASIDVADPLTPLSDVMEGRPAVKEKRVVLRLALTTGRAVLEMSTPPLASEKDSPSR